MPAPEGEYFEPARFTRLITAARWRRAVVGLVLCLFGALKDQPAVQFLLALRVLLFLHSLLRLFVLDDRASRHRCRMVGSGAAATGKHRACFSSALFLFAIPILILRHHLFEWMNIPPGKDARARQ